MNELSIKRVLVTGASGKIGRSLVPSLVEHGYQVRAVQFQTPIDFKDIEVVKGSVSDVAFVKEALKDVDAVCHLATCKEDKDHFLDTSVRGTFNLLDVSRDCGSLKQFILAGGDASLGIFFYPNPEPLDEQAPLRAYPGYYAFSKVLEETMCNQYRIQYNFPVTILRFSWIHDEDDILAYMTLAKPNFGGPAWKDIATLPEQKEYLTEGRDAVGKLVHPDGTPYIRHIVGIKDVVKSFLLALGTPAAIGETFNIAAPTPFRYDELSSYIAKKLALLVIEFKLNEFYDFSIKISKARSVLGYHAECDTFKIVDDAIAFRRSEKKRSPVKY